MKLKFKLILIAGLVVSVGAGVRASLLAYHKGAISVATPYITLIPGADVRNDQVAKGDFKLYGFPVIADGRPYTIVVEPIAGRPELYASRYRSDVDELIDILSWWCDDDHCGQSATYDGFQTFTFYAPTREADYLSWFSVYGDTGSAYSVRVVNQTNIVRAQTVTVPASPAPEPVSSAPQNGNALRWVASPVERGEYIAQDQHGNVWQAIPYVAAGWAEINLPDKSAVCEDCSKFYRGKFRVLNPEQDVFVEFTSDDGVEIYVNGQLLGVWGGAYGTQVGCVNDAICEVNKVLGPINIRQYLRAGENVIAVRLYNGVDNARFNLNIQ